MLYLTLSSLINHGKSNFLTETKNYLKGFFLLSHFLISLAKIIFKYELHIKKN